ncbi:MAG: response regulator [Thermodesulfobacteriota bacterium]
MDRPAVILIADDHPDTVELLVKRFRAEGYRTLTAVDGESALDQAREALPDCVILDVRMPKLDGFEVCRLLKADPRTRYTPILMLTAQRGVPNKVKGLTIGADDYLTKPFDFKELAVRVKSLLAKKAASEQLAAEEKLEAVEGMINEVAHEVRNPLVSIGGFARRLYRNLAPEDPNRRYLEIILRDVDRLERMVSDLVAYKTASLTFFEPVAVNDVLLAALDGFRVAAAAANLQVVTELAPDLPAIPADRQNLERAIANMIENAIEAMSEGGGRLTLTTRLRDEACELVIADTGCGIAKDRIKNIYDPFVTSKVYGPGLGLTFALKTIQAHRGMIAVESEEGRGTTFTIQLPVRRRGS